MQWDVFTPIPHADKLINCTATFQHIQITSTLDKVVKVAMYWLTRWQAWLPLWSEQFQPTAHKPIVHTSPQPLISHQALNIDS